MNVSTSLDNVSTGNSSMDILAQLECESKQLLFEEASFRYGCSFGYFLIFLAGILGNVLVLWVILTTPDMRTTTNLYIFNLSLGDILMCAVAVPMTPASAFIGDFLYDNSLGGILCKLLPSGSATSVYMSTLTLTAIAIERYRTIIHPFKPRPGIPWTLVIIVGIDVISLVVSLPYAYFMELKVNLVTGDTSCDETWDRNIRLAFGTFTNITQFALPFATIIICYAKIMKRISQRSSAGLPGSRSAKKRLEEQERAKRINWMLISMVAIFGVSWFPLNLINLTGDLVNLNCWSYYYAAFFIFHMLAMTSTCYNPILYRFLNSQFKKEFIRILPWLMTCSNGNAEEGEEEGQQKMNGKPTEESVCLINTTKPEIKGNTLHGDIKEIPSSTLKNQIELNGTTESPISYV